DDNTLALGGDDDNDFDVSDISSTDADEPKQYQGFDAFEKTGDSVWELTGTAGSAAAKPWTIEQGTLRADDDDALPDDAPYAVNGGTLDLNDHDLVMGALSGDGGNVRLGDAALTVDQDDDTTYQGDITGEGPFAKKGGGT